jgi:peptide/nickel transport system ATP-binding protein
LQVGPSVQNDLVEAAIAPEALLSVRGLSIHFAGAGREIQATRDVSFDIRPGERVGLVGESGCGKTITGLSILRLLPREVTRITGEVWFEGANLLTMEERALRRVRGSRVSMIFQEPMSALDPVFTIGEQIVETLCAHFPVPRKEAWEKAVDALAAVGIPLPDKRAHEYPHELSGGMRQRAMIAMALACEPRLLIADEPTTALDVTIQAQIIDLLLELSERTGTALLLVSHDIGVVAQTCNRVLTMYAGEIIESGAVDEILTRPRHPYTAALLRSQPRLSPRKTTLPSIAGQLPWLLAMPEGCRFAGRCAFAEQYCVAHEQVLDDADSHAVRCCRHRELRLQGALA